MLKHGWNPERGWITREIVNDEEINLFSPNVASGTDFLQNITGFSKYGGNPSLSSSTEHYDTGSRSFKAVYSNQWDSWFVDVLGLTEGTQYTVRFKYLLIGNTITLYKKASDDSYIGQSNLVENGGFGEVTFDITVPAGKSGLRFQFALASTGSSTMYFDTANIKPKI